MGRLITKTAQQWFSENLESVKETFEYRLERMLLDVGDHMAWYMKEHHLSRAQMAQRLRVSPAYVTTMLNVNPNLTIKTLLRLSDVLGKDVRLMRGL